MSRPLVVVTDFIRPPIGRRTIDRLEKCKIIVRCGVGYDNVDRVAARERGITVANVPDYGTEEVADSAIAMLLTMMRGVSYMNTRLQGRQGEWIYEQVRPLHRLRGLKLGIVGLGRIGTATALRATAPGSVGAPAGSGARRPRGRAAAGERSPHRRLAHPRHARPRPGDHQSPLGVLFRAGPRRHADQGQHEHPPRPRGQAGAERGEIVRRDLT